MMQFFPNYKVWTMSPIESLNFFFFFFFFFLETIDPLKNALAI